MADDAASGPAPATQTDGSETPATPQRARGARIALVALCVVYAVGWSSVARVRFRNFHFTSDALNFNHMLWRTAHGDFLPSCLYGRCHLADHASFFLVALAPIYALYPHMGWLLFLQAAALASAAWPMWLIARRCLGGEWAALAAAAAFLFSPGIVSQTLNQVHETQFVCVFVLFAFYFFDVGRFRPFVLCCLAATMGKETVPLTLFMFGPYAALRRRKARWVAFPVVFAALYLAVVVGLILPAAWGSGDYRHSQHFGAYGSGMREIGWTMLTRPGLVWGISTEPQKLVYLRETLQPFAFVLALGGGAALMALPDFVVNVTASQPALAVVAWHYSVLIAAFLCVATVQTIARLTRRVGPRHRRGVEFGLLLVWLAATALSANSWAFVAETRAPPDWEARRRVLRLIPADPRVSVVAPPSLAASLSERYRVVNFERRNVDFATFDYIVVNRKELKDPKAVARLRAALYQGRHELVLRDGDWLVYKRIGERTREGAPVRGRKGPGGAGE